MKPTGNLVQDEMFPEGVDSSLMDMDEVNISLSGVVRSWQCITGITLKNISSVFTQNALQVEFETA